MAINVQTLLNTVAQRLVQASGNNALENYHPFLRAILVEDGELAMKMLREARQQRKIQEIVTLKTEQNHTPLSLALENGMLKLAMELLSLPGIPVFEKNRNGDNALMIAVRENYKDIILRIFGMPDIKKYINDVNKNGEDAFMIAVKNKNFGLADTLLSLGANLEGRDKEGNTRLMTAITELPNDCVQYLLSKGADINAKNTKGDTALIVAVKQENKYAVRYLCEQGASVSVRDAAGKSLEEIIKSHKETSENRAILELVKTQSSRPSTPHNYTKMFLDALSNNNLDTFKYCLTTINRDFMNLEISALGNRKWKPIHIAACLGHLELVQFMLDLDESLINEKDAQGDNPLHIAAASGQLEVVKYLCKEGADLTAKNLLQEDALNLARRNSKDVVAKFIHNEMIERQRRIERECLDDNIRLFDRASFIEMFEADARNPAAEGLHLRGLALIAHYFSNKGTPFFVAENEIVLRHALSLMKQAKDGTEYGIVSRISGHAFAIKCEKYDGINHIILMDSLGTDEISAYALNALGAFNYGMYLEAILPEIFQDQPGRTCYYQNKEGRQTSGPVCSIFTAKDMRKMLLCKNLSRTLLQEGAKKTGVRVISNTTLQSNIDRNTVTNFEYNTPDRFMRLTQSPDKFMGHVIKKRKEKIEPQAKLPASLPDDIRETMNMLDMYNEYEGKLREEQSQQAIEKLYNANDPLNFLTKELEFQSLPQYAMRSRNKFGVQTPEKIKNRNYHPQNNPNVPQFILKNNSIEYFRNKYVHIVDEMLGMYSQKQLQLIIQAYNAKHLKLIFPENDHNNSHSRYSANDKWGLLGYKKPEGILYQPYREELFKKIRERIEKRKRDENEEFALMRLKDRQSSSSQSNQTVLQQQSGDVQSQSQGVQQAQSPDRDDEGQPKAKRARHI